MHVIFIFLWLIGPISGGFQNPKTQINANLEDESNIDDSQQIGVIGKGKSIEISYE